MKLGSDFVLKPFDARLLVVIRKVLSVSRYQLENRPTASSSTSGSRSRRTRPAMQPIYDPSAKSGRQDRRADRRRDGTGKARRARHSLLSPRALSSCRSTAPPSQRSSSRASSGTRGAFTGAHASASFRRPTKGRSSSTRSATWTIRCKPSCYACCRRASSSRWANRRVPVDVRIVSSTNRDLEQSIRDGVRRTSPTA